MATTGVAVYPGSSTFPGASVYPGQGSQPLLLCFYTTDDASNSTPVWSDASSKVRSFSVSRGRESELSQFDAGTATIVIDDRDRAFDPNNNAAIRPFNRWWLRAQFSGETYDLFVGYAESYKNEWPDGGWSDAITTVECADEFKVLALDSLPNTDPPRSTYGDLVSFDDPDTYWAMNDDLSVSSGGVVEMTDTSPAEPPDPAGPSLGLIEFRRSGSRTAVRGSDRGRF